MPRGTKARTLFEAEQLNMELQGDIVSYTASLITQGKSRFYTLAMPSDVLARTCTVDTHEADPIAVANQRWGLHGDFVLTCTFIIALCREVFVQIGARSSEGRHSFARTGPIAFLNDIGVVSA